MKILIILLLSVGIICAQERKTALATWDANTELDLKGYRIYYGTSPHNYTKNWHIGNKTSVVVDSLEVGKTYYLALTAYDLSGNESGFSDEVTFFVAPDIDSTAPAIPRNFKVVIDTNKGTISVTVGDTTEVKN